MKTLKPLLGLAVVIAGFWMAWKLIPPYFANYQLEDFMMQEARFNAYTPKSENDMRETVFKKAQELDIPLTREQINVQRAGNSISIWAEYSVHVDLPYHPLDLRFVPTAKNKGI